MNDIEELSEKLNKIIDKGWIECNNKNSNVAGIMLEEFLEIHSENFEIPDYNSIEIKTKVATKEKYVSLFCASPDSYLFETKRLYEKYGYINCKSQKVLNFSCYGGYYKKIKSNYFVKLNVDRENKKVILEIYDNKYKIIDKYSSWSFDLLKEKLYRKLNFLCMINGEKRFSHNKLFIKYTDYKFYKLKNFDKFIDLLDKGYIRIAFTIDLFQTGKKIGQVHDHGTKFCIKEENLELLFDFIK